VHNILTNPIYAGAYAFGRTTSRVSVVDGRKRIRRGGSTSESCTRFSRSALQRSPLEALTPAPETV
jgi:hypothetical protein